MRTQHRDTHARSGTQPARPGGAAFPPNLGAQAPRTPNDRQTPASRRGLGQLSDAPRQPTGSEGCKVAAGRDPGKRAPKTAPQRGPQSQDTSTANSCAAAGARTSPASPETRCAAAQASLLPARGFCVARYGVWAASGERPVLTGGGSPGSSQLPAGGGQMHRALFPAPAVRAAACRTHCSDGALISPSRARAGTVVSVGERECTATPIPLTFLIRCIYVREKACLPACWRSFRGPRSGSPSLSALPRGLRAGHLGDRPAGPQSRRGARWGCAHRPPGSPASWSHRWSSGPVPLPSAHLDTEPQRPVHSPDSV